MGEAYQSFNNFRHIEYRKIVAYWTNKIFVKHFSKINRRYCCIKWAKFNKSQGKFDQK